jgi:hypothetical protein
LRRLATEIWAKFGGALAETSNILVMVKKRITSDYEYWFKKIALRIL